MAEEAIKGQRKAFKRWGVMADWSATYRTLDPSYVTSQLQLFAHLFHTDYIYQVRIFSHEDRDFCSVFGAFAYSTAPSVKGYNLVLKDVLYIGYQFCILKL